MAAKFRNLIFLALLAFLFVEVLIVFPSKVEQNSDAANPGTASNPQEETAHDKIPFDQTMQGVHYVESQKGSRDWEFYAEGAEGSQGHGGWQLQKVKVHFYSQDKIEFTVIGDQGKIDSKTRNMSIRGHVVTSSANGYTFRSEEVDYNAARRRISSPGVIAMTGPPDTEGSGMKVSGQEMLVEVDEKRMTIRSDVRAERDFRSGKKSRITSDSAEFNGKNKEARFLGHVVMQYDKARLEGPEATFVYQGDSLLNSVQFRGGVKVGDADKFATSENLNLDLLTNRFVFTGRPKVYQNNDELSGEQIIFLDGGKKVKVEKVRARVEKSDGP